MLEETQDSNEMFIKRNVRVSADSRIFDPENDSIFLNIDDDSNSFHKSQLNFIILINFYNINLKINNGQPD